jgi:plasmid stabilization system protein ParE
MSSKLTRQAQAKLRDLISITKELEGVAQVVELGRSMRPWTEKEHEYKACKSNIGLINSHLP